ncbi:unnamed protein product, partial [Rotaria sp. Silwood2]
VSCGGDRTELSALLFATTPPKEFRSMLEYLLYRAGFFHLEHRNLCQYKICENHYKYLTSYDHKDNCKLCKAVRQCPTTGTSSLRSVTKPMALRVWQEGYLMHTWAVYGKSVCNWIYNENIVYLPSPSEPASQHSNYEPQFEYFTNSQRQDSFETLKRCLIETGFTGRVQKHSSLTTLTEHGRRNVQTQTLKILQHTLKILLEDDAEEIWNNIIDNYQSNSYTNQK